jgi:hypothetical protein
MDKILNEANNNANFENDWDLFVDIENYYSSNNNYKVIEKIYYTFDDYEYEYNKKMEIEHKKMEKNQLQDNSNKCSSYIFHITTIIVTSTITYCILCLL